MLRSFRTCFVVLLLCVGCADGESPAGDDPPDDTDPIGLGGRGGWEGSNCMGAAYGITLLDDNNQLVTVRQSMAIGVVVDAIQLVSQINEGGGVEVMIEGLDRFLAVGLRNWMHKIGEVLLPDEEWVAAYDPDNVEWGSGHYNLLGTLAACQEMVGALSPAVARTLAMFLYALSQMASCPEGQAAEGDGNFVSVYLHIYPTLSLAGQLPAGPGSPTLGQMFASAAARPVPPGAAPDPTMTCILWGFPAKVDVAYEPVIVDEPPPTYELPTTDEREGLSFFAAPDAVCLVEARVEAMVTTVPRFHPTFQSGPAGEPVSFSALPVVQSAGALGAPSSVRHFLADNHVGTIDRVEAYTTCDDPRYAPYGSPFNPCPAALARWHFAGTQVKRKAAGLPFDLEAALAPYFPIGSILEGILVIIPFDSAPVCMAECPPERAAPTSEVCE